MLLIASTNNKFVITIRRISFHDMPQNRHTANFNHRLRFKCRFFGNSGSEASRKDYYLHMLPSNHFAPSRFKITTAVLITHSASIHSEQFLT